MQRRNFINKSYKHKLRATYTMLMFVVLIFVSTFLYYQVNKIVNPLINEASAQIVDSEARNLGQQFNNQIVMLEQLACTEVFKTGDFSMIKRELDNQMNLHRDIWLSMDYKSVTGKEYAINPGNIKVPASYEKELLTGAPLTIIKKPAVINKSGEYITFIGTKVVDNNGNVKGILTINSRVQQLIMTMENQKLVQNNKLWVVDSMGKPVMGPPKDNKMINDIKNFDKSASVKSSGELSVSTMKGGTGSLIYSSIPNSQGLYLAMGIEHRDFSKAMNFLVFIILAGAILASLFIFVAANKMTTFITTPLTRMVEIIEHSDGTNLIEIPNDLKSSKDEIGILANTIDELVRNIRNNMQALNGEIKERQKAEEELILFNDGLECRVEERTLALTKATNSLTISEDRFRIAMEASHIGLYDADTINNALIVNGVFLKLINAPQYRQGLVKESDWVEFSCKLEDYIYEEDIFKIPQLCDMDLQVSGEDFYTEFRLKEDVNSWFSFIGQATKKDEAGRVMRFIGVLQNISERKTTEALLKAAKEEAEEASKAKSQFLANMSHEIRTPMNAIMGLTHLISQSELNDSQENYISKIDISSKTLLRIINDILDFSKIEAGKMEIENIKFNLDKVFENVSTLYTNLATNKGIDINFDLGEWVPEALIGDPLRLEQIISNLTTNAIKFTSHGEVNIGVRIAAETENKVKLHFSVTDTGIGLTKEQMDVLFTAFTQADNSMTRKYGGTGLGLTITKQLVELMDGEIWVESEYGEGSSFQFMIEFDKVSNIIKPIYEGYPDLLGKKVLVVDHNKTSLMILERMLKSFLLEVTAVGHPYEAIELLEGSNYDLLVIDFNLPELSGIDLYKRLVVNTEIKVPCTIFVSANGRESYYNAVNQLGVKNLLVKPINQSLMFDAVMDALKITAIKEGNKEFNEESQLKFQRALMDKRILLVEDNDINQLVAKDILEQAGIHVSIASNGEEAIKHVHANKFDAVLMDMQMPIMDGYKATEILRKTYSSSELPIIAMTANALLGDRERSIEVGMNDYISKPINPEILFDILVKWLLGSNMKKAESSIEPTANENLEILDYENTLIRLGNKKAFYNDLLNKYYENYSNLVKELSDMILNNQNEEAKRLIHSVKGVTGNIGAVKIYDYIVEFENQFDTLDEISMDDKLKKLRNLNEELLNSINKFILEKAPKEVLKSSDFELYNALTALLEALQKARAKEIKDFMGYLVVNTQDGNYSIKISEIKKLVERYRFKEAKVLVQELMLRIKEPHNG
jgi:two-component system, sensor histidine kinase and response regulator